MALGYSHYTSPAAVASWPVASVGWGMADTLTQAELLPA